ncbi:hypothetical protein [Thalassolituus hydrocarboniclasticus]|uniref:Uncharacterized protein n=1 Tax=Thalassolituus hydrocarboniclasticus TaxID=2742796 RepID=A0ABY6A8H6_9GAMM|nr:hypothetical protein [Thalassolituus hydrocarboniclasticus]UXD86200.1 hypothetical protein HUF19_01495 [Thalassolituus hydrocarboniclasticus]
MNGCIKNSHRTYNHRTYTSVCLSALICLLLPGTASGRNDIGVTEPTVAEPAFSAKAALPAEMDLSVTTIPFNTQSYDGIYTLGGVRLKLTLNQSSLSTEDQTEIPNIIWTFGQAGRVCTDMNMLADNSNCQVLPLGFEYQRADNTATTENEQFTVFWEPLDWTLGMNVIATARTDNGDRVVTAESHGTTLTVPYPESRFELLLSTRILGPAADGEELTEGSDVKMLEQMLWQLGVSPQYGYPGKDGARIASRRSSSGEGTINTTDCGGHAANDRSVFYSDWNGCNDNGSVSTEGMLRRFQGRSFDAPVEIEPGRSAYTNLKGLTTVGNINGSLNQETLNQLQKVWTHFYTAVSAHANTGQYTTTNLPDNAWAAVRTMLSTGGVIPYNGNAGYNITASYDNDDHMAVITNFPAAARDITTDGVIRAWVKQESENIHWGGGSYQRTDYRMYEGSGDDEGSMGFNHIVWKRLYGTETDCNEVRGFIGDTTNVNMYNPVNSLYGLVVAGAHASCRSSNGLFRSFNDASYVQNIAEADRPVAYCYEAIATASTAANRCSSITGDNRSVHIFNATQDTGMHLLGKAMVGYNAGTGRPSTNYFGDRMLGSTRAVTSSGDYVKTRFGYWMAIKHHTQADTDPGYLPYTTYIWPSYQNGLDLNGNGVIENTPDADGVIEANTPWCYAYGELDWMNPKTMREPGRPDRDYRKQDYFDDAVDDISIRVGCS